MFSRNKYALIRAAIFVVASLIGYAIISLVVMPIDVKPEGEAVIRGISVFVGIMAATFPYEFEG